MRQFRVALLTQGYFTAGGVQTVARWVRGELLRHGHHVDVFDLASSRADPDSRRLVRPRTWLRGPRIRPDGREPQVWRVGCSLAELEPVRYLPRRGLTQLLRDYDVIQVVAGGPALACAAADAGRPVALQVATRVRWERADASRAQGGAGWARRAMTGLVDVQERRALAAADAVLVENAAMRSFAESLAPGRVHLAPPGVDTDRFRPSVEGWDPEGPILAVGRLGDARKGYERVIEAYRLVCTQSSRPPALVLAGRGRLSSSCTDAIAALPAHARVEILSDVPDEELPCLYRRASVFVQGSHEEGLGLSVVEAMACGVPTVVTDTAGTRETVLDGVTGFLVDQGEQAAAALTHGVRTVLQQSGRRMHAAARERSLAFSSDVTFRRYLEAYDAITRDVAPRDRYPAEA